MLEQRRRGRRVRWATAVDDAILVVVLLLLLLLMLEQMLLVLLDLLLDLLEVTEARQRVEDLGQTAGRSFIGHCSGRSTPLQRGLHGGSTRSAAWLYGGNIY